MERKLVEESYIILDAEATTFEEVILLIGEQFKAAGIVKDSYPEAVIARERIYPTGLPANGYTIGIPHTDSEHVLHPGVGVIVTKEPIEIAMMGSPEVLLKSRIFFPLAMEHPKKQLDLLKQLMKFFQSEEKLSAIYHAKSKSDVLEAVTGLNL